MAELILSHDVGHSFLHHGFDIFRHDLKKNKELIEKGHLERIPVTIKYDHNDYVASIDHPRGNLYRVMFRKPLKDALTKKFSKYVCNEMVQGRYPVVEGFEVIMGLFSTDIDYVWELKEISEKYPDSPEMEKVEKEPMLPFDDIITLPLPEQIIYYGTPGCGKSHYVNGFIEKRMGKDAKKPYKNVFRTTFHPDTDYASFVGTFKPLMVSDGKERHIEYDFVSQVFTDAYEYAYSNPKTPVFLVIEEINRGNCAQIFGDLFQLLDRDLETGISEYPIKANNDLKNYLVGRLGEENDGIVNGEIRLPRNFNIIATMNTSDQSLFPMDSAFKRRWSWKYMKIDYENEDSAEYTITIDKDHSYSWNDFLKSVNSHIYSLTKSEDKQLGNFFVKGTIDKETFISKVMFYLWSEICKEEVGNKRSFYFTTYRFDDESPKDQDKYEFKFSDLFDKEADDILIGFMNFLKVTNISEE